MKLLHIDIETAPNTAHVWGIWQQNVGINQLMESSYVMCWAAKWHNKKGVLFSSAYANGHDAMLQEMWDLLDEADAVVHYNGTKFDIPTLNKEFVLAGMTPPSPYHQIDLLSVARKQFRFPSNKLDYVAQALGLGGKTKHTGHELWVKCMNDDPVAWKMMERYNKQDVRLLEKLYAELLPWIKGHPNVALYTNPERPTCTNCGSEHVHSRGSSYTKQMRYNRYQCTKCNTWMRGRVNNLPKEERGVLLTQDRGTQ